MTGEKKNKNRISVQILSKTVTTHNCSRIQDVDSVQSIVIINCNIAKQSLYNTN